MQVLLVDPHDRLPWGVAEFLSQSGWDVQAACDYRSAHDAAEAAPPDAMVVPVPAAGRQPADRDEFRKLVGTIRERQVATVLVSAGPATPSLDDLPYADTAAGDVTKEEIRGRLSTLMRYHTVICGMERELNSMRRLSKRLNQHFAEVDQEMRLAGRLQRDFLPRIEGPIGPARFATMFRPATEVSGDIYDVYRVDEDHVAFYVADAVGHGVAASLLTMFIKEAIVSKRIVNGSHEIIDPSQTLYGLNEALASQMLPNCQFVTACYCLLNTRTLELACCRGGHPYPFLVEPDGTLVELKPSGGLLGLFRDEEFETHRVRLRPGQKLVLYTDGLELAFAPDPQRQDSHTYYREALRQLAPLPVEEIVAHLHDQLDNESGSLNPHDDVTVVAMEVLPS
jgi:sigma-B regulation protein RsbU (phosphoserine phosphatase)